MKYAREVIELLGAYPGRRFKVGEIVRYIVGADGVGAGRRDRVRVGVWRVIEALQEAGLVRVVRLGGNAHARVFWRECVTRPAAKVSRESAQCARVSASSDSAGA